VWLGVSTAQHCRLGRRAQGRAASGVSRCEHCLARPGARRGRTRHDTPWCTARARDGLGAGLVPRRGAAGSGRLARPSASAASWRGCSTRAGAREAEGGARSARRLRPGGDASGWRPEGRGGAQHCCGGRRRDARGEGRSSAARTPGRGEGAAYGRRGKAGAQGGRLGGWRARHRRQSREPRLEGRGGRPAAEGAGGWRG
jgi:hypothetical protein